MDKIPNIAFFKKRNRHIDFDAVMLRNLFARPAPTDHRMDSDHRPSFYCIILISKGTGIHRIDFNPYRFKADSILFISKEQTHSFDKRFQFDGILLAFKEKFLTKHLIHSDTLFLHRLFNYHLHVPIIHRKEQAKENLATIIHEIYNEYHSNRNYAKEAILRSQLKILLLKADRIKQSLISTVNKPGWVDVFTRFKSLIASHNSETRNAKDYAGKLNISYKHLNEICKTATGHTAKQFIDVFLILEIKRQLAISNLSIKELTYRFGFDEPTNFQKYFKKHTDQTPVQFRRALQ